MINRWLSTLPIKRKLTAITLLISGVALVTALAAFLAVQLKLARDNAAQDLTALAQIVAANATGSLAFSDREAAELTLRSLQARPDIERARLFDAAGKEFGTVDLVPAPHAPTGIVASARTQIYVDGTHVFIVQPVIHLGETLGRLELSANLLGPLLRLLAIGSGVLVGIFALSIGLAYLLVARLQRTITHPLSQLAAAARTVASERDYTLRVPRTSSDEIGDLTDAFNQMVSEVGERDLALSAAKQQLAAQVIVLQHEIRERERTESELQRAKEAAESANVAKSSFLATMSHEIRTPMNGVLATTNLLLDSPLNDEQRELTGLIRVSGEGLLTVLNDILDFSKLEAGRVSLEHTDFDLRDLIEDAVELQAVAAAGKGLELASDIAPELATAVRGDPYRVRQVLMNLVGNAVKFTPRGEVVVSTTRSYANEDKNIYRIEVRDSGIGLSAEAREKLFRPFTQADSSTSRRFGGTGLGLAISKALVELMGGTIGVESQLGQGSTFWFTLPLDSSQVVTASALPISHLAGRCLLLVEPNEGSRQRLRRQLTKWSVNTVEATDVPSALAALASSNFPIDAALICLCPADGPGLSLARQLAALPAWRKQPLILLTNQSERVATRGLAAKGISACLFRPIRVRQLATTLQRLFGLEASAHLPLAPQHSAAPTVSPDALRVLLFEDNVVNQRVAFLMLQKLNCDVTIAGDGREGLELLSCRMYDLILMDCQMPEIDGFEATRQIRLAEKTHQWGDRGTHQIVAMTANAMAGDRERCLEAGMDDYISKPLSTELLATIIQRARENTLAPAPQPVPSLRQNHR